jgi:hypothetical protein
MKRLAMLLSAVLAVSCALCIEGTPATEAAVAQKKQPPKTKRKNAVNGALWSFVATNRQGKQIRFRYRAEDLVLYDPDSGAVIGKSEPVAEKRSRVTFNERSQFPATFEIRQTDTAPNPKWAGRANLDNDTWTIEPRGLIN